jgi:hypothetical protein
VGGGEDVVVVTTVLEVEQVGAEGLPAAGGLVGVGGQQSREVDLLGTGERHLLAHDGLDLAEHGQSQRQPRVDPRCLPADVSGAVQQSVAGHLGADRVLLLGSHEQGRHAQGHRCFSSTRQDSDRTLSHAGGPRESGVERSGVSTRSTTWVSPDSSPGGRELDWWVLRRSPAPVGAPGPPTGTHRHDESERYEEHA